MNWSALWLTLQVTATATAGIVIFGLALALLLSRVEFRGKLLVETVIMLPLVLPPTVVGYSLLILLGRDSALQTWLHIEVLFTWQAAVLASMIVGLPLMIQASRVAFDEVEPEIEDAARVDGAAEWYLFWRVTLPIARRGVLAGLILASARAMGEFGATVMIAGNIPGRTQTLPLAIYDAVQARRYDDAGLMVIIMTLIAFSGLWIAYQLSGPRTSRSKRGTRQPSGAFR
ncbi:MAG: molybdate ABC transporter permease subunit [Anaerolineae bacterium]|nr:molybdate ABC transporter permease subunit [Anaerolineae bacterium]